jgi:hypothetical protein
VSHRAATAVPLVLIAACAAAFLRAEQLKLHHSDVAHPHVRQVFSPGCTDPGCRRVATLRFTLRKAQTLTLSVVDVPGDVTRTLAAGRPFPKGRLTVRWDGSTNAGATAADGRYRLRVTLASGRNVTIPDPIVIDTVPPRIRITRIHKGPDSVAVRYRLSPGIVHAVMIALRGDRTVLEKRIHSRIARLRYSALPAGRYRIEMVAVDKAGNRTPDPPSFPVTIP